LIGSKNIENSDLVQELIQRIQSVLRAKETKYVVLNVPKANLTEILALLPGVKSPSV
jgi:ATP phosphoribosyltransferase